MTEEIKNEEKKECKCCECREKLKEFLFKAAIVYVGTTLAILTAASILKPKCPCAGFKNRPGIERPYGMHRQYPPRMHKGEFHHRQFQKGLPDKVHSPQAKPQAPAAAPQPVKK